MPKAFFATLTNVNFDSARIVAYVNQALAYRQQLAAKLAPLAVQADTLPAAASFEPGADLLAQLAQAPQTAVNRGKNEVNEDIMGLRLLCLYGLKGRRRLHGTRPGAGSAGCRGRRRIPSHHELARHGSLRSGSLFKCAMDIGLLNFKIMEMLDLGETTAFGHPEPTQVRVTPVPGKCILVSGHDMVDLKLILEQTRALASRSTPTARCCRPWPTLLQAVPAPGG